MSVDEIMTRDPICCTQEASLEEAGRSGADGRCIGMVAQADSRPIPAASAVQV